MRTEVITPGRQKLATLHLIPYGVNFSVGCSGLGGDPYVFARGPERQQRRQG
jgi:hypothetical protein